MITYRSRFLARAEVWFDDEPVSKPPVDWILYHQRSQPVPGAHAKPFHTYAIDLTQSHEQLLASLTRDTAYKIRRARERDGISCTLGNPRDSTLLDRFEEGYNAFARAKGLLPLNRMRLNSIALAGLLDLTVATDQHGTPMVVHANYRDSQRATGMELLALYRTLSDSAARNLVGRANRYLTWCDILRYKEQGLRLFDFGGWYYGNDPGMLHVNDFKKGFGGKILCEYQCEQVLTLKGRLVLTMAAVLARARRVVGVLE